MREWLQFLIEPGRPVAPERRLIAAVWATAVTAALMLAGGVSAVVKAAAVADDVPQLASPLTVLAGAAGASLLFLITQVVFALAVLGGCRSFGLRTPLVSLIQICLLASPVKALLGAYTLLMADYAGGDPLAVRYALSVAKLLGDSLQSPTAIVVANYASLPQLWALVMVALAIASWTPSPRWRAVAAVAPAVVLSLLYEVMGRIIAGITVPQTP